MKLRELISETEYSDCELFSMSFGEISSRFMAGNMSEVGEVVDMAKKHSKKCPSAKKVYDIIKDADDIDLEDKLRKARKYYN